MKLIYKYIITCCLASAIAVNATSQDSTYYTTLNNYKIDCEKIQLHQGVEKELTLRLTNPAPIEGIFQVDVTLPGGMIFMPVDTLGNYCAAAGSATVKYKYFSEENSMRVLVNNNFQDIPKSTNMAIAKVKIQTTEDFISDGSIEFSNVIFTLSGDGKGYYGAQTPVSAQPIIDVDSIGMNMDTLSMKVGETTTELTASIIPEYATNPKLKWTSKKPWVAEVNVNTGKVIARSIGETDVVVTTQDGTNHADTCHVIVRAKIDSLKLDVDSMIKLNVDDEVDIAYTVVPASMKKSVKFSVLNPEIATIDDNGHVTAVGNGVTAVAVQTTDGSNLLAMCKVKVGDDEQVAGLKGDMDDNGIIDVEDVNSLINIILKIDNDDPESMRNLERLKASLRAKDASTQSEAHESAREMN